MATVVYFLPTRYDGDTTWLAQYYGDQTSTLFTVMDDAGGLRSVYVGNDFSYGYNGFFNGGTITAEYGFSVTGELSAAIEDISLSVSLRNSLLSVGTSAYALYQEILKNNDTIVGSDGDDKILGSKGSDVLNAGNGVDLLSFKGFAGSASVNLATGSAITNYGESEIANFEDVEGSAYADTLVGNAGNNVIQGYAGNDAIDGGAGVDTAVYLDAGAAVTVNLATGGVIGGSGNDRLTSVERIVGSRFGDNLTGSSANEYFVGGFGDDGINGGGGIDTVEYTISAGSVGVSLSTGEVVGGAGSDILVGIENIIGSVFNDVLIGSAIANVIKGGSSNDLIEGLAGNDTLYGDDGSDTLTGGVGNDVLVGGAGSDGFKFLARNEGQDTIQDFTKGQDKLIFVSSNFGNLAVGNLVAGRFRINASGLAGDADDRFIFESDTKILRFDANGNAAGGAYAIARLNINNLAASDIMITSS